MEWPITVWHEPRLIYVAVAKVANTAVKAVLLNSYVEDRHWKDPHHESTPYESATPADVLEKYADYTTFAVVRNPFDRLVSFWSDKIVGPGWYPRFGRDGFVRGQSFHDAAARAVEIPDSKSDPHMASQVMRLKHDGKLLPDTILRFDSLADDWVRLQEIAGANGAAPLKALPKRRVSEHEAWHSYYDRGLAAKVAKRYREDFATFAYDPRKFGA